jgi:molecular chaperone GrpE
MSERAEELLQAEREARLRLAADFSNFRRRVAEEREAADSEAVSALIDRLIKLADFIDLAIAASPPEIAHGPHGEGLAGLRRELLAILASQGVTPFDALGLPFDPTHHQALARLERPELTPGTIVVEHHRGYLRGQRLCRPALVSVSFVEEPGPSEAPAQSSP